MTRCEIIKHSAFLKVKVLPTIESLKIAQYYTHSHVGAWGKRGLWSMGCGWDTLHIYSDPNAVSDKSENLIFGKN